MGIIGIVLSLFGFLGRLFGSSDDGTGVLEVNHDLTLSEALESAHLGLVDEIDWGAYYRTEKKGVVNLKYKMFRFKRDMSYEDVVKAMNKKGFRPADFGELLALARKNSEERWACSILALGSILWSECGNPLAPFLAFSGSQRLLSVNFSGLWHTGNQFLAVREL